MLTLLCQNQTCGLQESGKDNHYDRSPAAVKVSGGLREHAPCQTVVVFVFPLF